MRLIEEQQAVTESKSLVLLSHKTLQMDSTVAGYFWNDVPPWRKVKTDKVLKATGHCIRGRPGLRNISPVLTLSIMIQLYLYQWLAATFSQGVFFHVDCTQTYSPRSNPLAGFPVGLC